MGKELRGSWRWIRIFCINLEECARFRAQKPKRQWSVLSVQWSEETRAEWLVARCARTGVAKTAMLWTRARSKTRSGLYVVPEGTTHKATREREKQ